MAISCLITFVVINWNLKQDTADCIDSLLKAGAGVENVIVVDNGSTDGSVDFLSAKFGSALEIVGLETNMGFAKGSNAGIQQALVRNADWIFLMNNDTFVAADFVEQLEHAIQIGGSTYSLFSPMILYYDLPKIIWSLGDRLVPGTMIGINPYIGKNAESFQFPEIFPVDFVNGCGMLVHRKVYQTVGMMDTRLFIYHEEVDLCWRVRLAGFRMAAVPNAKMWHKISSIMGKQKPKTRYLQTRNQIWVFRRYASGLKKVIMFFFSVGRAFRLIFQDAKMHQLGLLPHLWRGWWEGWTDDPRRGDIS